MLLYKWESQLKNINVSMDSIKLKNMVTAKKVLEKKFPEKSPKISH